jgi:GTP-binding protein
MKSPKARPATSKKKKIFREHHVNPANYPVAESSLTVGENNAPIPPAALLPTASPHVYVAKRACMDADIDPRSLFADVVRRSSILKPEEQEAEEEGSCDASAISASASSTPVSSSSSSSTKGVSYVTLQQFPMESNTADTAEVAFLGRSNVGKSSLINALLGEKNLAVTSKQPGRTQRVYYYDWSIWGNKHDKKKNRHPEGSFFLVDLPGYGYSVGPDAQVSEWQRRSQRFLERSRDAGTLRRLFLLQDVRVGKQTAGDALVMAWLEEAEIPYTVVLTKADRVGKAAVVQHANWCCLRYHHQCSADTLTDVFMSPTVHVTSARRQTGLAELRSGIEAEFSYDWMEEEEAE